MGSATFKNMSRALVIALVVVVALVGYDIKIPRADHPPATGSS
jgi:hypothetical protein